MLERLDAIIEAHKYSKHPFVQEVLAGNVTREGVTNWAIQKYFQVYGQNRGFSGIHSNAPYEDVRQFQIEQLIAEETGIEEGTDTHYGLMKRFAFSMGATEEDFNIEPGAAVKAHVDHMINTCTKEHFVYGMLAFYTIESQTPEAVLKLAEAFKQQFGSTEEDLEWFYVHGGADVEHSEIAEIPDQQICIGSTALRSEGPAARGNGLQDLGKPPRPLLRDDDRQGCRRSKINQI